MLAVDLTLVMLISFFYNSRWRICCASPIFCQSQQVLHAQLLASGTPGLINLPQIQRQVGRLSVMSTRASAATLETATKQNVGAAASKSQTHVGLNSGHHMPLVGWGTSGANGDECIKATKAAIEAGYRVGVDAAAVSNCNDTTMAARFKRCASGM